MIDAVSVEYSRVGDDLLGLADYYEAVLKRNELVTKESEFRSSKLSLIVDLIRTMEIPDGLMLDLTVAIIDAWTMAVPGSTAELVSEDRRMVLQSLDEIRSSVVKAKRSLSPQAKLYLDMAVQFALPMRSSDLQKEGATRVQDLLNQARDCLGRECSIAFSSGQGRNRLN
ncbi:MAG TPA: hypothetical protein VN455_04420 [Methanotrichaceae archaeon]|nr:hypothetical protein [Methanotrichaceae archaeon]